MRIVAIAKHVPDSRATVRVSADGKGLDAAGLKFVCDPFDEIGLELAVRLRAERGDVEEIVAITIGPASAVETLRHALAMGADRAIHIAADVPHHDEIGASRLYAAAIRGLEGLGGFGLVVCGARNTDTGAGELGPALAQRLGCGHAPATTRLEIGDGGRVRAWCRVEGGELAMEGALPLVVSCERGLAEPHHPPLPKVMKAKKAPVESLAADAVGGVERGGAELAALAPPRSRPTCRMVEGDAQAMARELARLLRHEAKVI